MAGKQIQSIIQLLNRASVDQDFWQPALKALGDLFNASVVQSVTFDNKSKELIDVTSVNRPAYYDRMHQEYYAKISPRIQAVTTAGNPVSYDYMFVDQATIRNHEFYEANKATDTYYHIGANDLGDERYACGIGFFRSSKYDHVDKNEIKLMEKLWPHLASAVRVRRAISASTKHLEPIIQALTLINQPAFIVNDEGKVHMMNSLAETELERHGGLKLSLERLVSYFPDDQPNLVKLLNNALAVSRGDQTFLERSDLQLRREFPQPNMRIVVQPLAATSSFMARKQGWVLLMTKSENERRDNQIERLVNEYQLTQAEVAVAMAMADGVRVIDYAKQKGVSVNTVRYQLRAIFEKTGTSRQPELIAKIYNL